MVNNGASLPLAFDEDLTTRTITVQLATDGGGTVTTTANDLLNGFRANNTIKQVWRVTGGGGSVLTTGSFQCSGGSVGDELATIHLRANSSNYKAGYNIVINPGDVLLARCTTIDVGSVASMQVSVFVSY